MECTRDLADILNGLKTIQSCGHMPEVETRYKDHAGFRFQMCRQCWSAAPAAQSRITKGMIKTLRLVCHMAEFFESLVGLLCTRDLADILNGLKTIQSCGHMPEVETRYKDHGETYHRARIRCR